MTSPASGRYNVASIALHWLTLLVIVGVYAAIEFREFYPKGSAPREALKNLHFMLGLSIFGLVWLRIAARLLWPAPAPAVASTWQRTSATTVHTALYALMIGMPIAGWIILSAEGDAIPFFGLELPPLVGPNESLAERTEELHKLGGTIGYWLIGIHAAASLTHQYIFRDRIFARMVPLRD